MPTAATGIWWTSNSVSEDAEVVENGEVVPSAAGAGRDEAELIEQHKAVSGVVEPTDGCA